MHQCWARMSYSSMQTDSGDQCFARFAAIKLHRQTRATAGGLHLALDQIPLATTSGQTLTVRGCVRA